MLLTKHKRKGFLHRIVTGDEKWIHYDNPNASTSTAVTMVFYRAKPRCRLQRTLQSSQGRILGVRQIKHGYLNNTKLIYRLFAYKNT